MPQMAPISWMILFFIFSISFILFNIMNYFCFFNLQKNNLSENNNNFKMFNNMNKKMNLNWKW